jgi:hypothetical protein
MLEYILVRGIIGASPSPSAPSGIIGSDAGAGGGILPPGIGKFPAPGLGAPTLPNGLPAGGKLCAADSGIPYISTNK